MVLAALMGGPLGASVGLLVRSIPSFVLLAPVIARQSMLAFDFQSDSTYTSFCNGVIRELMQE